MGETKKRRRAAYFGIHTDFHATANTEDIGAFTDAKEVGAFLDAVKPEYWQIDTKGHPGYASYFTKIGTAAPGLAVDYLKIIREETKKRGILLIAHHSSLWDDVAAAAHPEWQNIDEGGKPTGILDSSSPYADEVLIPMLKELAGEYGFDGVWLDGGIWAVRENFAPATKRRFTEKTGIEDISGTEERAAYCEFLLDEYRAFVTHCCTEIKRDYPDFEICDNAMSGPYCPVAPIEGTDFLSYDTSEYEIERITTRLFALTGKPWDIMYWGSPYAFKSKGGGLYPNAAYHVDTLLRGGALAISMGGGYQAILQMSPRAEFCFPLMRQYVKLHDFLEERKKFCYGSRPTMNGAAHLESEYEMMHSEKDQGVALGVLCAQNMYRDNIGAPLDGGLPFDVETDSRVLSGAADGRPALFVNNKYYSAELKSALLRYAQNGGTLVLSGPNACAAFSALTTAKMREFEGVAHIVPIRDEDGCNYFAGIDGAKKSTAVFDDADGDVLLETRVDSFAATAAKCTAAFVKPYGKGKIAFSGIDFFGEYLTRAQATNRPFQLALVVRKLIFDLGIKPEAYVKHGVRIADVIPAQKDGKFMVNVIKTLGFMARTNYDFPPVDVTIAVKLAARPKRVMLEPQHVEAEFDYDGEYAYVKIRGLDIHTVVIPE